MIEEEMQTQTYFLRTPPSSSQLLPSPRFAAAGLRSCSPSPSSYIYISDIITTVAGSEKVQRNMDLTRSSPRIGTLKQRKHHGCKGNLSCFVSFRFVLFCFVLVCFVSFRFVSFRFVLFCFVLFCFVLFCFVLFCFVLFCFVLTWFDLILLLHLPPLLVLIFVLYCRAQHMSCTTTSTAYPELSPIVSLYAYRIFQVLAQEYVSFSYVFISNVTYLYPLFFFFFCCSSMEQNWGSQEILRRVCESE